MTARLAMKVNSLWWQMRVSRISRRVRRRRLTYLSYPRIHTLERRIRHIQRTGIPGIFLETGVALGGSAIIISSLMSPLRVFRGYDLFEMIPPPSDIDGAKAMARFDLIKSGASRGIGGDDYYGYIDNLYDRVVRNFEAFGLAVDGKRISLHRGRFDDTFVVPPGERIALAHIDCDWYESVCLCLKRVYGALSERGFVIVDDYHDYAGCARAVHEFLAEHEDIQVVDARSNLTLQRVTT